MSMMPLEGWWPFEKSKPTQDDHGRLVKEQAHREVQALLGLKDPGCRRRSPEHGSGIAFNKTSFVAQLYKT